MSDRTPHVLVVDDERFFREGICEALGGAGIACLPLETAAQALEAARDPAAGVVVLDVALPDLGGIELMRPELRVIVLSGQPDQDLVLEALRLDAHDYLAKPLHDEELVLSVRRALAAFDVESSWQRLRERVRRLEGRVSYLTREAEQLGTDAAGIAAFAHTVATAVAEVVDAEKTSLMVMDAATQQLTVAAATGSGLEPHEMDPVALGEGVAGLVLSHGEAVIVDDVYSDPRFGERAVRERYRTGSLAVVPLMRGDHPLGVLCATDRSDGAPFGEDELALLNLLAGPVAAFLGRALVPTRAALPPSPADAGDEGSDLQAELAREICEAAVAEIDPERIAAGVLRPVARLLRGPVALYLIDNAAGELRLLHQVDDAGPGDHEALGRDRGLTGTVLQAGALVACDHPERDPRFDPEVDTARDGKVRALLCVPLRLRGKVLGVFRGFPEEGALASPRTGEILSAALSAATRVVLLYRSLLESIEEVAEARREAVRGRGT